MSLRQRLADFIGGKRPVAVENSTPSTKIIRGSSLWEAFVQSASAGSPLAESTALTVSAIYACVNLIAGAIAALPVHIYKQNISNGERDRIFGDSLIWVFNEQMTPRWSAANGWEFMVQSLLLQGDAFARILRNSVAEPVGLEPFHPRRVTVYVTADLQRLVYAVDPEFAGGNQMVLDQDDMLHVGGFGFDGMRGLSPLRNALRTTGYASNAMQEFAANFFANSARPDYALTTDQKLGQDAIDTLRAQIDENHRSPAKAHRPMLLHSGLDIKTITVPPEEMQLLESRQFQIEEIARIYGVPPFMIGHNEKTTSWGSGVESMGIGFVRYSLRQHLNKFQTEINRKFFRTAARVAEFDTTDLERADTKSFYEGLRIAVGRAGEPQLITIDEARAEMRRNKRGMDTLGVNGGTAPPEPKPKAVSQKQLRLDFLDAARSIPPAVVNVTTPEVRVEVAAPQVTVEPQNITVNPPAITIEGAKIEVHPPAVTIEGAKIEVLVPEQKPTKKITDGIEHDAKGRIKKFVTKEVPA